MKHKLKPVLNQKTGKYENCFIQNLNTEDIKKITALQDKIISSLADPDLFVPFKEDEIKRLFENEENIILGVFTQDGRLIALRAATVAGKEFEDVNYFLENKFENKKKLLLNGSFVDVDYRGNRLQIKMTSHTIQTAKKENIDLLFTVIHPDNIASIKSISSLGFEAVKEITVYDEKHTRILFIKELQ